MTRTIALPAELRPLAAALTRLLPGPAWLVGGTPRDLLLDAPLRDLDLAVADAEAAARAVADGLAGHLVTLDAGRHIYRVALDGAAVRYVDIAQLRGDLDADLRERDFTLDAMAAPLQPPFDALSLVDPLGGARDAGARLLRAASTRIFQDDPLRLLRAVRLAVEFDLSIEQDTEALARENAALAARPSPDRQRDEIARIFASERAAAGVRLLDRLGLLDPVLPEVATGRGVEQPKEHHYPVLEHNVETVRALDVFLSPRPLADAGDEALRLMLWTALPAAERVQTNLAEELVEGRSRRTLLKLAGLLHDIAKPQTKAPDPSGRIRFFGHPELGARMTAALLRRLRFAEREVAYVCLLVDEHLRPLQLAAPGQSPTPRALFRFFRDLAEAAEGVLLLSLADHVAARGPELEMKEWQWHLGYTGYLLHERYTNQTVVRPVRLLTGDDLMAALGIGPGPEVGRLLAALEEAQAAGEVSDRSQALAFVRRLAVGTRPHTS